MATRSTEGIGTVKPLRSSPVPVSVVVRVPWDRPRFNENQDSELVRLLTAFHNSKKPVDWEFIAQLVGATVDDCVRRYQILAKQAQAMRQQQQPEQAMIPEHQRVSTTVPFSNLFLPESPVIPETPVLDGSPGIHLSSTPSPVTGHAPAYFEDVSSFFQSDG